MEEKKLVPKLRFPGFTEPWEQRKLGDLFKERNERSEQGDLISVTISQGVIKASDLDRDINSSVDKHNYKRVRSGDVVYNTMRMWQGACGHSPYEGILSPAYTVLIPGEDTLGKLFDYYFKHTELLQIFKKYSQGMTSDTWNLKFDILKHISLPLPSVEEQVEIAQLFSKYDNLITLHQRKLEHLKLKKKSLLQKLFPKEGEVNPELRFPGFTDPWEQRKLGEMTSFSKGNGYFKSDLKSTGIPIILYGRLYTKYETVIEDIDTFADAKEGAVYSLGGEVIVPASGETAEEISIASVVQNPGVLLGGDLNIIRPIKNLLPSFLALSISNGSAHREMSKRAQGKSVVHLHNEDLAQIDLKYPSVEEQSKITACINWVDNLITLHQEESFLHKYML